MALMIVAASAGLLVQGRLWWCAYGDSNLWSGKVLSEHNSQHLFDPYSFTHVLHGVLWCWVLVWVWPRLAVAWQLALAVGTSALWEVIENTDFVIRRFREATISLDYYGDTVANSVGDTLCCAAGFGLARWLGFRWSLAVFVTTEMILLFWIRDNLTLNVLMLLYPLEAVKTWQLGQ